MDAQTITLPKTQTKIYYYSLIAVSFLIPLLISGPQLLTGSVVNAFLFLTVYFFEKKQTLPIIMLPSIGAVLNGLVFGTFTPFLLYFLPFIWMGNYILSFVFAKMHKKSSIISSVFISSLCKALFLFLIANIYVGVQVVPSIFLKAMGLFQLGTALIGGALAFIIYKSISKKI